MVVDSIEKDFLIKLGPVIEIVRTAIWSGRIADERPVSVMLIAEQESAKTEVLKYFSGTSTLRYFSDLTSKGINPLKGDIERGRIRHLVLMDLVRIVSHGKATSERTLQTLATLMEEGESASSDPGSMLVWDNFPKIGCLMGITTPYFNSRRAHWRKTGFLTRFIPVCYSYNSGTVMDIHKSIAKGKGFPKPNPEKLPEFPNAVVIPKAIADEIAIRARMIGQEMETYGFRYHRVFRALVKSTARLRGSGEVNKEDLEKVLSWSKFFTMEAVKL